MAREGHRHLRQSPGESAADDPVGGGELGAAWSAAGVRRRRGAHLHRRHHLGRYAAPGGLRRHDRWSFEARFEQGGVITYRKHLAVLVGRLILPTLLLLATLAVSGAALSGSVFPASGLFYPLAGLAGAAAVLWWLYEFADWANDLYQITPTHIVAVHKKPLGRESRKLAPLENILGTEVDRRGPIGMMLNFGDVVANVGASSFTFEGVLNPSAAQQDIVRAQETLVDRRTQTDRQRRRDEMVEWLSAYHQQTTPTASPAPPDGTRRSRGGAPPAPGRRAH